MTDEPIRAAYRARAAEYTALFGSVEDMHKLDRQRIEQWAMGIEGQVIDVGCGPGRWTNHLHQRGVKVQGVDLVPEFIETARARFPDMSFGGSPLSAVSAYRMDPCRVCSPGIP